MCLFFVFLQYSLWLNHASFWHTDVTSVKIACTLFLFLSTILLTSSFFLSVLAWSIAPQGCRPPLDHWHCFTELQLGDQGAVSTWPWNSFSGCCYFVDFVLVASDFCCCVHIPPNFNDSQLSGSLHRLAALFCKCTTRGSRRGTVSTSTWPNYVWSIEPLLLRRSWGRKDISWDWLPEYTALICFILLKSWKFLCQSYK